jgi:hypothetical protein
LHRCDETLASARYGPVVVNGRKTGFMGCGISFYVRGMFWNVACGVMDTPLRYFAKCAALCKLFEAYIGNFEQMAA